MKSKFLPVGLVLAILWGALFPHAGICVDATELGPVSLRTVLVVLIFLIMGYTIRRDALKKIRSFLLPICCGVAVGLLLGPLLGIGVVRCFQPEEGIALGLLVMACMPTTLSSAIVLTNVAGGSSVLAVLLTVVMNLFGVVVLPFTLRMALASGSSISMDPWPLFWKIIEQVLIPIIVGAFLQIPLRSKTVSWLGMVPQACVIAFVWMAISKQSATLASVGVGLIGLTVGQSLIVHIGLLLIAAGLWKLFRFSREYGIPLLFTGSQKTLPIMVAVLVLLRTAEPSLDPLIGKATLAGVLFHFSQILFDSVIASRLCRSSMTASSAGAPSVPPTSSAS